MPSFVHKYKDEARFLLVIAGGSIVIGLFLVGLRACVIAFPAPGVYGGDGVSYIAGEACTINAPLTLKPEELVAKAQWCAAIHADWAAKAKE